MQDLHRTGCTGFCGTDAEEDRVVLKRVLLAYARWNKSVGYCQGFNVIAALILEIMEHVEDEALKVGGVIRIRKRLGIWKSLGLTKGSPRKTLIKKCTSITYKRKLELQ